MRGRHPKGRPSQASLFRHSPYPYMADDVDRLDVSKIETAGRGLHQIRGDSLVRVLGPVVTPVVLGPRASGFSLGRPRAGVVRRGSGLRGDGGDGVSRLVGPGPGAGDLMVRRRWPWNRRALVCSGV